MIALPLLQVAPVACLGLRMPFGQLRNIRIEEIPGVAACGAENNSRFEAGGVVEATDIDTDELRTFIRLVVERYATNRAEALSLRGISVATGPTLTFGALVGRQR